MCLIWRIHTSSLCLLNVQTYSDMTLYYFKDYHCLLLCVAINVFFFLKMKIETNVLLRHPDITEAQSKHYRQRIICILTFVHIVPTDTSNTTETVSPERSSCIFIDRWNKTFKVSIYIQLISNFSWIQLNSFLLNVFEEKAIGESNSLSYSMYVLNRSIDTNVPELIGGK